MLQPLLLTAFGALFALLFVLLVLIRLLLRKEKVSFWDTLLAFLVTGLLVIALFLNHAEPAQTQPALTNVIQLLGTGLAAFGLLFMLLELLRAQRWRGSRGLLMLWSGALVVIASFLMPLLAQRFQFTPPTPVFIASQGTPVTRSAAQSDSTEEAAALSSTPTPTLTETATPTPTQTRTPRPTATPTPTRERFVYRTNTPEPSPTVSNPCLVLVKFNLRLRTSPNREAETLAVIPFDTNITAYGRNDSSTWWYVTYEDQFGWIDGEFVEVSSACAALPVQPFD